MRPRGYIGKWKQKRADNAFIKLWFPPFCQCLYNDRNVVTVGKIRAALDNGANVNATDSMGETALMDAAAADDDSMVECPDANPTSCIDSRAANCLACVKYLVSRGAAVNVRDKERTSALMYAAHGGHADLVNYLVSQGAKVNAVDVGGRTPLSMATDYPKVAVILKAAGAK